MSGSFLTETGPVGERLYLAGRGTALRARDWRSEGLLRAFENVLEVGENPAELIVYASLGRAARDWPAAAAIAEALLTLGEAETLVLQSGVPAGVIRTHAGAPRVLSAVNNTVGRWAGEDRFYERQASGDTMWGGLTAGAWQYIGRQGVLGGTYELLRIIIDRHLAGVVTDQHWMLTAGMGGMGSSQPISAAMLGLSSLVVEVDPAKVDRLRGVGALTAVASSLDEALALVLSPGTVCVGLVGNAADVFPEIAARHVVPTIVTDQTAAHDARYGYVPSGFDLSRWAATRESDPGVVEAAARRSMAAQVEAMLLFQAAGAVVFENGNNLRVQAIESLGAEHHDRVSGIPGFMEYLRPLFARGIGPFRWIALSGDDRDLAIVDDAVRGLFPRRPEIAEWIDLARRHIPPQGLPARSCWLGHGERSALAVHVNGLVAAGNLSAPVLFTRDHLDSASMTHPRIGTEGMRDGSDGVTDWPLLDALLMSATGADLVAIHSGGGGYAGWMQSAGVSVIADGEDSTADRLRLTLDADSGLGVLRHAAAGYEEAHAAVSGGGETGDARLVWLARGGQGKGQRNA